MSTARPRPEWAYNRPATTIVGSFRPDVVAAPGYRRAGDGPRQNAPGSVTITQEEAALLQSYPPYEQEVVLTKQFADRTVLDLCAGTGVGVGVRNLGAEELGVEIMPAAIQSRDLNGMITAYENMWDIERAEDFRPFDTLWASPPCQTFSLAGRGAGRQALDDVLRLIAHEPWAHSQDLRLMKRISTALFDDERTALVLVPLAYAYWYRPSTIAFEQVGPVLPVWEAAAEYLRSLGYSTWTGLLYSEQYGVPQTRKRAYLLASKEKEVGPPIPTHSRFHVRDPQRLDPGVEKWVSMAEALGWEDGVAGFPRRADSLGGTVTIGGVQYRERDLRDVAHPSQTVTEKARSWQFIANNRLANSARRDVAQPAPTITAGHDSGNRVWTDGESARLVTTVEAQQLQSYPGPFQFAGSRTKQFLQIGNAVPPRVAQRVLESLWA